MKNKTCMALFGDCRAEASLKSRMSTGNATIKTEKKANKMTDAQNLRNSHGSRTLVIAG